MVHIITSFNNFARAKLDHDMQGRFDLPIYQTSADIYKNWISNFKGNATYRSAFQDMLEYEDAALIEFKYSDTQNYLLVLTANKMRVASYDSSDNFGWVESSPGVPLEIATPYTLAESKIIANDKPSQNFDAMIFTINGHEPRKLLRTGAASFTFNTFSRKDDPFALTFAATKVITNITQANPAVVSVAAHGYTTGQRVRLKSVVGMTEINGYTGTITNLTAGTFSIDIDTTKFTAYSSAGTAELGLTFSYPAHNLFYGSKLYYASTSIETTTVWGSEDAKYDIFTIPVTVLATSALKFVLAEFSQKIEWLFKGDNAMIAGSADGLIAIHGSAVGDAITAETIDTTPTSAEGCSSAYPIKKDGLVFYVGKNKRNVYYFRYDVLSETFGAEDANFISYDITDGLITKLRFKKDRNDLIYALKADYTFDTCNFNAKEQIIGWHDHNLAGESVAAEMRDIAVITDNAGNSQTFALNKYGSGYYIEREAEYVSFKVRTDFFTGSSAADKLLDDEAYNRYVAEQLKECIYLDNASIYTDLQSNLITYAGDTEVESIGTITATSAVFALSSEGKHIVYKTATGYESGRFEITNYLSTTQVEVKVLQKPTSLTYTDWYLSFTTVTGLAKYNANTVGIVTDGGYFKDDEINAGTYTFDAQVTHVVFGYRYKGIIKSFPLGFQVQGRSSQVTVTGITAFHIRTTASAGLKVGSSLYNLESVQELTPDNINYLPPIPMDGTKEITFSDDYLKDKCFYLVQDEPLPAIVNAIMVDGEYTF